MGSLGRFPNAELVCFVNMLVGKIEVNNHFTDFIYIYQAVLYA